MRSKKMCVIATADFACERNFDARDLEKGVCGSVRLHNLMPDDGCGLRACRCHRRWLAFTCQTNTQPCVLCLLPRCQVRITRLRSRKGYNNYARPGNHYRLSASIFGCLLWQYGSIFAVRVSHFLPHDPNDNNVLAKCFEMFGSAGGFFTTLLEFDTAVSARSWAK
jgi:hypothetical protein